MIGGYDSAIADVLTIGNTDKSFRLLIQVEAVAGAAVSAWRASHQFVDGCAAGEDLLDVAADSGLHA